MKTLGDKTVVDHLSVVIGVRRCPKCGTGTDTIYTKRTVSNPGSKLIGSICRECELMWKVTIDGGNNYTITGSPQRPREKRRNYWIRVRFTDHYIKAATAEDAREKLIKKLKLKGSEKFGVYVEHMGDHAECNEGIPI